MTTRPKFSEGETLEQYRVALDNAQLQPAISAMLAELGYSTTVLDEGKALLIETVRIYNQNKTETDQSLAAHAAFAAAKDKLDELFNLHRKKAQVVFRNDTITSDRLAISGAMARTYASWYADVSKFYSVATSDTEIQSKLARLNVPVAELTTGHTLISEVNAKRSSYLKEKGESQDATKAKDAAFAKMDDWMSEFYAVARIGLADNLQLLEALGKTVKS
jgi:rRNA-processing protein FCF1